MAPRARAQRHDLGGHRATRPAKQVGHLTSIARDKGALRQHHIPHGGRLKPQAWLVGRGGASGAKSWACVLRGSQMEQRVQMLLGIFSSHGVLTLKVKPAHSMQSLARDLGSSFLHNAFPPCEDRRLRAVGQLQLTQDVAHMTFHRIRADHELLGNLTIGLSRGD